MQIDLKAKRAFIAGVADEQGFGWAIARALAEAGARVSVGTWAPLVKMFTMALERGKFDEARRLSSGDLMTFDKIYPLDVTYDHPDEVPKEILNHKRYKNVSGYTLSEVARALERDWGTIDILVHSIANASEIKKPLLETSRKGYLAAMSASSYSLVGLLRHLGPLIHPGGSVLALTYLASERVVPGYGGGMSSAKAALESDVQTLAWEAGRKWGVRVNAISAGAWRSRAAKAIGFIDRMINYARTNGPLNKPLEAYEVGNAASFLLSPLASAITGTVLYVDNGIHCMAVARDSLSFGAVEALETADSETIAIIS